MTLVETSVAASLAALVATGLLAVATVGHRSIGSVTSALTTAREIRTLTEVWITDTSRSSSLTATDGVVILDCVPRSPDCEIRYRVDEGGIVRDVTVAGAVIDTRSFTDTEPSLTISPEPGTDVALVLGSAPATLAAWTAPQR